MAGTKRNSSVTSGIDASSSSVSSGIESPSSDFSDIEKRDDGFG